jgi:hypothetical protein
VFERFTDRARRVVVLAQEEARIQYHNYIGTEHILLGLIHEGEGVAAKSLEALGVSLDKVRDQVEEIIGQGQQAPSGHIPFTPRAKKVMELSLREALQLGHNYIGTEHVLLGLVREGEGVASQVLVQVLGPDALTRARKQIIHILGVTYDGPAQTPPAIPIDKDIQDAVRAAVGVGLDERAISTAVAEGIKVATASHQDSTLGAQDAKITKVRQAKNRAIDNTDFDKAAELREQLRKVTTGPVTDQQVQTGLTDEQFEEFKRHLRYEVTDLFTGNSRVFPLRWEGRKLVGIEWGDFDMGQPITS